VDVVGLGVDLVDVGRIEKMLEDRAFLTRVFSEDEIAHCEDSARPAECFAARWAAREACAKALGGIPEGRWSDIRIVLNGGAPSVDLTGAARERADAIGATRFLVSFSHEGDRAVACCIALGEHTS
jgi:holo-[acyl-carrier protein] synthase